MRLRLLFALLSVCLVVNSWADGVPVGTISAYGGISAPVGWYLCDGASLSRSVESNLYDVIGVGFGSVDGSHFNLPDFRGVFLKGAGTTSRTVGKDAVGAFYSAVLGTYYLDHLQGHNHNNSDRYNATGFGSAALTYSSASGTYTENNYGNVLGPRTDGTHGTVRSDSATTEPQSLGVNFIIKALPVDVVTNGCTTNIYIPAVNATWDDLNEVLVWRLKVGLWIFGGICGLICAVCFFARS